jgi:pimeloyl-ACP methyl ester carboxylesterase
MAEWQEFDWQSLMQDWRADGMKRGYADTPEGQIHYVVAGEGDALVLIHQMVRSSRMWLKVMPLLAEKYKVVAVDMLGHGFSASPPLEGDTVSILADSVVHTMDELGIPKAHVLGLHTGAGTTAEIAAIYPERVGVIMLMSYPLLETEAERRATQDAGNDFWGRDLGGITRPDGGHLMAVWMRAYADMIREWLMLPRPSVDHYRHEDSIIKRRFVPDVPFAPTQMRPAHWHMTPDQLQFMDNFIADWFEGKGRHMGVRNSLRTRDAKSRLPLIKAPTYYIEPDSLYVNAELVRGKVMKEKYIPQCEVVTLEGGGDNVAEFNPPLMANFILNLLDKHTL